jgi:hypothetical protein
VLNHRTFFDFPDCVFLEPRILADLIAIAPQRSTQRLFAELVSRVSGKHRSKQASYLKNVSKKMQNMN